MRILRTSVTVIFLVVLVIFCVFRIQQLSADKTYPVITIEGEVIEVSITATNADLLQGVTAWDEKDGDISDKVIVESISRFTEIGVCVVDYAVCDYDNHVSKASRKIVYTDYTPPKFTLSGSLLFGISQNMNIRSLLGAVDSIDGNISNKVIITANDYSSAAAGVNYISAKVTNSKGDMISLDLPVYVEERNLSAPEIILKYYMIYLTAGDEFDVEGNVISALDTDENNLKDQIHIDTNLDLSTPGVYEIHYRTEDSHNRKGHAITTVIVEAAES